MEKQFIQLQNSVELAYQWINPTELKEDFVIVFLHEALGSIGQWRKFPQLLCDSLGAKGLIYERQGYGSSSPLTTKRDSSYLEKYALDEMPQVIRKLVPDKKTFLVGHSDGGSIALLYSSKYPENILGVITMAAHVIVEEVTLEGIQPAINAYQDGKLDGLKKYHGEKTEDIFYAWADTWLSEEYRNWNICNKIEQSIPSFILQGDQDEYGTEQQLELIESKLKNAATYLIPDCHHQPHLEKTEEINVLLKDWISKEIRRRKQN